MSMTGKGAIIDIGAWLQGHGLGQYEDTFRQNEIDVEILPALTESHLEKLGVPLGHRIRLLKAIADLEATERPATALGSAAAPALYPPQRHHQRQRRLPRRPLASVGTSR
jgi:SAM domain (Sterile alpha motif)